MRINTHLDSTRTEANRQNAQNSTGPTSEAGKSITRYNATRHGLTGHVACMTWEDRDAFNTFCAAIVTDLKPEGAVETQLAQAIAEDHWRLNRTRAIEENLFTLGLAENNLDAGDPQATAALSQADTFRINPPSFNLITIYEARLNRNLHRNMGRLKQLQHDRQTTQTNNRAAALHELAALNAVNRANRQETVRTHNGFVFSDAELALAARGQNLSSLLAEATLLTGKPPKSPQSTRTFTYKDAA